LFSNKILFSILILPKNIFKIKIFTAAHCIQDKTVEQPKAPDSIYAFIGKYDLKREEGGVTRGFFSSIRIHPDWDYSSVKYDADIAVLVLKNKITYGPYIQPACLPAPTTNVFNTRGTVVGYGLTENTTTHENRPKFVEIASIENEDCLWKNQIYHHIGSKRSFCAGDWNKKACRGDSGGGFYVKNDDTYTVNGIVSAGSFDCDASQYVVFTSVPKFVDWIRREMEMGDEEKVLFLSCSYHYCKSTQLISITPDTRITSITGNLDYPNLSDVNSVYISSANVTFFPDFKLLTRYFPKLSSLSVTHSGLKYVERKQLASFHQLTQLDLYENLIESLAENVFSDLVNLEYLNIARNKIKVLPRKLLSNLPKLKTLISYGNRIELIPRDFLKYNRELETIEMSGNRITRIEVNFTLLPKLKSLDLTGNVCINPDYCYECDKKQLAELQKKINLNCGV
jgi:hypothetical protein